LSFCRTPSKPEQGSFSDLAAAHGRAWSRRQRQRRFERQFSKVHIAPLSFPTFEEEDDLVADYEAETQAQVMQDIEYSSLNCISEEQPDKGKFVFKFKPEQPATKPKNVYKRKREVVTQKVNQGNVQITSKKKKWNFSFEGGIAANTDSTSSVERLVGRVSNDNKLVQKWLKAAKSGCGLKERSEAIFSLAYCKSRASDFKELEISRNDDLAFELYVRAGAMGHRLAQVEVARCYRCWTLKFGSNRKCPHVVFVLWQARLGNRKIFGQGRGVASEGSNGSIKS